MKQRIDVLLYPLADALQMQLDYTASGITGLANRVINLGPWRLDVQLRAQSCVITDKQVGIQVYVRKNLFLYMVCDNEGKRLRAILFDGIAAGLRHRQDSLGSDKDRVAKALKQAAKLHLMYDPVSEKWSKTDAFDLV